jgi:hypothetical protein
MLGYFGITNRCAALENLNDNVDISRTWSMTENTIMSAKISVGNFETLSLDMTWRFDEMNGSVEEAKLQREQNPCVLTRGFVKSIQCYVTRKGRDSSVGIVTWYGLDDLDMKSQLFLDFLHMSKLTMGPPSPNYNWYHCSIPDQGSWALNPRWKRPYR